MSSTPNSAAARHMHRLFAEGTISGAPDGQLLEQFLERRDESAFTALVERHGPMVFGTCAENAGDHGDGLERARLHRLGLCATGTGVASSRRSNGQRAKCALFAPRPAEDKQTE
jgi:hypothetical protein